MTDIIIVGGGCAGLTAALYAARAGKSVLLFEAENIGGQITAASLIENYPGLPGVSGLAFADSLFTQATDLGVEIELDRVLSVEDFGDVKAVTSEGGRCECRSVIFATGAKHRKLGLPREEELTGHGISYCALCDGAFYKGQRAIVIGGGNTAFGDALFLASVCKSVTIIHRREAFRADLALVERAKTKENIVFVTGIVPAEFLGGKNLEGVRVKSTTTDESKVIPADVVFVAIGHEPETELFRELLETDVDGYFVAGEDCVTNRTGIFAAGDCRTKTIRQLTTAAADGSVSAMAALDFV